MKKKILGIILGLFMMSQVQATISVAPTRLEINADKQRANYITTALDVRGDSKKPMRFKAYTEYFTIDEKGEMVMIEKSDDQYNIAKKIKFVPSEFTVQPGKNQKLRVNIAGLNQLQKGEHRAVIYLEDVNPKEYNVDTGRPNIGAQLIVKTRMGIPVYIDKGVTRKGEIEEFTLNQTKDGFTADMKILSTGNTRIRYNAKIQIIKDNDLIEEVSLPSNVIGQNSFIKKQENFKLNKTPSGVYTARLVISFTDQNNKKQVIKKETTINIQGEM